MKYRGLLVLCSAAVLVGSAFGITNATPTGNSSRSSSKSSSGSYGVVADPPLPQAAPVVALADDQSIADHDGSVVVLWSGATLHFIEAAVTKSVDIGVGPSAELRAVSADGSRAALFEELPGFSRITVVDRSSGTPTTAVHELPGLVEPEAFSTDGGRLFVIDHQVSGVPGAYRVRPFDLTTGELQEILGPTKVPFDDDMNGVGRRQVWAPDAQRLYTLYIRQTHHHHEDDGDHSGHDSDHNSGHGEAGTDGFVHVLDLREEWAFCLDLPEAFGGGELESTALAVSPDGRTVAVADVSAGAVAFASTEDLAVTGTVPLPAFELAGELHLGLGGKTDQDTMLFLASGDQGQWFDGKTQEPLDREPARFSAAIRGITSVPDSVLVWTTNLSLGPTEVRSPAGKASG